MRTEFEPDALMACLKTWAPVAAQTCGLESLYLFGSIFHRRGQLFSIAASDIDLLAVFGAGEDDPVQRVVCCEQLVSQIQLLEQSLRPEIRTARDPESSLVSLGALTHFELEHGVNIARDPHFLSANVFLDLVTPDRPGKPLDGVLSARLEWHEESVLAECQNWRKKFLMAQRAEKNHVALESSAEAFLKKIGRTAAMYQNYVAGEPPLDRYDVPTGIVFILGLLGKAPKVARVSEAARNLAARTFRPDVNLLTPPDWLLLWEVLASEVIGHARRRLRGKPQIVRADQPFRSVRDQLLVPSPEIETHPVFAEVLPHLAAASGRMLVFAEAWDRGWYAPNLKYERLGSLDLPEDLQTTVDARSQKVQRPWWGKLAFADLIRPLSERMGTLQVRSTSYLPYTVLWQTLDEAPRDIGHSLRQTYWQEDLKRGYSGSVLPHILCAHIVVRAPDDRLLLTRRSRDVHFEARAWCPSIEEQAADGRGEATDEEVQAYLAEWREEKPVDHSVGETVLRGLKEELAIDPGTISSLRCYALATDWTYSDVAIIVVACSRLPSTELQYFRGSDSGEFQPNPRTRIQFHWMPLTVDGLLALFGDADYEPEPGWRGKWHTSAKLRLFATLCSMVEEKQTSWEDVAHQLATWRRLTSR